MPVTRYRCTSCGNLTRFDVTTTRRTRAFHHYTVGGQLELEDVEVLAETVEEVSCRWCGTGHAVVEISADEAQRADQVDDQVDGQLGGHLGVHVQSADGPGVGRQG